MTQWGQCRNHGSPIIDWKPMIIYDWISSDQLRRNNAHTCSFSVNKIVSRASYENEVMPCRNGISPMIYQWVLHYVRHISIYLVSIKAVRVNSYLDNVSPMKSLINVKKFDNGLLIIDTSRVWYDSRNIKHEKTVYDQQIGKTHWPTCLTRISLWVVITGRIIDGNGETHCVSVSEIKTDSYSGLMTTVVRSILRIMTHEKTE